MVKLTPERSKKFSQLMHCANPASLVPFLISFVFLFSFCWYFVLLIIIFFVVFQNFLYSSALKSSLTDCVVCWQILIYRVESCGIRQPKDLPYLLWIQVNISVCFCWMSSYNEVIGSYITLIFRVCLDLLRLCSQDVSQISVFLKRHLFHQSTLVYCYHKITLNAWCSKYLVCH